jgi:uncharacterized membrane protein
MILHPLLKSKRFWAAVVGLVFMIVGAFLPDLDLTAEMYSEAVLTLIGMLIGGYAAEDVVKSFKGTKE